eukprot:PhF_6_TR14252/c0_g1_i1/m.22887
MITFEVPSTVLASGSLEGGLSDGGPSFPSTVSGNPLSLPYHLYVVRYRTSLPQYSHAMETQVVLRRYSDFVWLQKCLSHVCRGTVVPPIPPKTFQGTLDKFTSSQSHNGNSSAGPSESDFVYVRRVQIELFLNAVGENELLVARPELYLFLTSPPSEFTSVKESTEKKVNVEKSLSYDRQMALYRVVQKCMPTNNSFSKSRLDVYLQNLRAAIGKVRILVESVGNERCKGGTTLLFDDFDSIRLPPVRDSYIGQRVCDASGSWGTIVFVDTSRPRVGVVWDDVYHGTTDGTDSDSGRRLFVSPTATAGSFIDIPALRTKLPSDAVTDALDEVSEQIQGSLSELQYHLVEPKPYQYLVAMLLYADSLLVAMETHLEQARNLGSLLQGAKVWLSNVRESKRDSIQDELAVEEGVSTLTPLLEELRGGETQEVRRVRSQVGAVLHKVSSVVLSNQTQNPLDSAQSSSSDLTLIQRMTSHIPEQRSVTDLVQDDLMCFTC